MRGMKDGGSRFAGYAPGRASVPDAVKTQDAGKGLG